MIDAAWVPLFGAIIGAIVGLTGVGGGALMAPILLFIFGMDLATVVATDLLFASITKVAASYSHQKNILIDWQITKRLWLGSIPSTLIVLFLAYKGILFNNEKWITAALSFLLVCSGLAMLFGSRVQFLQRARRIKNPKLFKKTQPFATSTAGVLLGSLVTATSVGAGALGALILKAIYPLRMKPAKLVATDTAHAIPVSLIGGIGYLALGTVDITILLLLLIGSIPTALFSSAYIAKLNSDILKSLLALILIAIGVKFFIFS